MALNPGSLAQYPALQSWSRVNPYPDGSSAVYDGSPLGVFDGAGTCAQALVFPRLSSEAPAGGFSTEMLQRIEHFVLNDNKAAAPPCALQRLPRGATRFPQIRPLSGGGG